MVWHWPQIVLLGWCAFAAICAILANGRPRTGTHNGALLILFIITELVVLYFGGFFAGAHP